MATAAKNLSQYSYEAVPDGKPFRVAVVYAEWNYDITGNLLKGAKETLLRHGLLEENLLEVKVPGAYELPLAAQWTIEQQQPDALIAIGCVIQGETRHFDYVCDAVTQGIKDLNLKYGVPVIFCVLTDNNHQQSIDRSGGKHGNKGIECAVAALQMCELKRKLKKDSRS